MQQEQGEVMIEGRIVTPERVIEEGMVIIRDGIIVEVGSNDRGGARKHANTYDWRDSWIIPGFIDIHSHGGGGVWSYDHPEHFAAFHLRHGTTSILPTFVYNQSHSEIMAGLRLVLQAIQKGDSTIIGIHMEGPYINPKYGAITAPIRQVNREEYEEILALAGDEIKLWTLAPELEGQQQFMDYAKNFEIAFSVGHSEADPETIFAAVRQGMQVGCHLTNASGVTPNHTRYAGTREVGVHEAVMLHDEMYAEVIPDQHGIHVRPLMLRLILKTKGVDRVIVITDAMDQAGTVEGTDVNMITGNEFTPDGEEGVLAGSLLTMNRAVYNFMQHTGAGIVDACKISALNPARLLQLDHQLGSIEVGKRANLLAVSEKMDVHHVMLAGNVVV